MSDETSIVASKTPMLRRVLNISSIACCVGCVAFMGLWIRSYRVTDEFIVPLPYGCDFAGHLGSGHPTFTLILPRAGAPHRWYWRADAVVKEVGDEISPLESFWNSIGFYFDVWPSSYYDLMLPYYFLVLGSGSLALIFRMRWPPRFTLRSLFVLTTFLAVVLGLIAWLDRAWIGK